MGPEEGSRMDVIVPLGFFFAAVMAIGQLA
jgi:hypothetical protein